MKKTRIAGVLGDAVKVAFAVWGTFWIEPRLEESFPHIWEGVHYFIAVLVAATILELLLQIALGWPRIQIVWSVKGEDAPITEIKAKIRKSNPNSQLFSLKISTPPGGWLGYQILRVYMLRGVKLKIQIERAPVRPTCEMSSKFNNRPAVMADDTSNGFMVDLGTAPKRPGPWHWAEVRWRDDSTPTGEEFNIYYVFEHKNAVVKFFLNCLIWRSKNARCFRVVGT